MSNLLIKNADIVLPDEKIENSSILISDGIISEIESGENKADKVLDFSDLTVLPGFIDIHIHGAVGVDVNDAGSDELIRMAKFLARKGTTAWVPTFVPDSDENYQKAISAIEVLIKTQSDLPVSQALGVHYEGVFANEKMCGALRPQFFKTFEKGSEIEGLPKIQNKNAVHLTTLAPEIQNGIKLIEELVKQNWIVSIGHTRADLETLESAKKAGAKHITHFFNAMTGLHHREIGVVGWGLADNEITFDIIADGIHVHPKALKLAVKAKAPKNVALISDAVLPTGLGDGDFEIWGEKVSVINGETQNERGSIAGSVITMLDAVKRMLALGFTENEVSRMASANPARILGIEKTHGSIEIGKRADLVGLDKEGNIKFTMIGGVIVNHSRE